MTKTLAIALEALCEKKIKEAVELDVTISMALTGRLKIETEDGYVTFNEDTTPDYCRYTGFYSDLNNFIENVAEVLKENKDIFYNLKWSYEHRKELTD